MDNALMKELQGAWEWLAVNGMGFLTAILYSVIILLAGIWVAKKVRNFLGKTLENRKVDQTLVKFATNMAYIAMVAFVVMAAVSKAGIQTASFVAVLGAAGLAVGLALQGSLSNFASGVMLIAFKPFGIGDYVEAAGVAGVVQELQIFSTVLNTLDNKRVIIPNSKLWGDNIINYSANELRRVDLVFGVSYSDDIDKVKKVLKEIADSDSRVKKDPATQIAVSEHGDSSVNFVMRPWVTVANYWGVYFDMHEAVKKRFDQEGISIPFPQRDLHVHGGNGIAAQTSAGASSEKPVARA